MKKVRLSRADSLHWKWNLELSQENRSSSGHMRKRWIVKWESWDGSIATQWMKCEHVGLWDLGLSWTDSPRMWPFMRNANEKWFRPETKLCYDNYKWDLVLCIIICLLFMVVVYIWFGIYENAIECKLNSLELCEYDLYISWKCCIRF